jgi:hypothetical protein
MVALTASELREFELHARGAPENHQRFRLLGRGHRAGLGPRTGCWSHTERVLLAYGQVRAYELPATEGKRGDPRWPAFARRHGFDPRRPVQWEVEALEPAELRRLVLAAVAPYVDRDVLARQIAREEEQRRALAAFLDGWDAAGGGAPA